MTATYTPRVGDKVKVCIPATVAEVAPSGVRLDAPELGPGWWAGSADPNVSLELVTPAPPPFEVGKPLTAEMGEPPVGSSVTYLTEGRQLRYTDTWIHTTTGWRDGDGSMMEWQFFAAAISGGVLVLDRLGDGK